MQFPFLQRDNQADAIIINPVRGYLLPRKLLGALRNVSQATCSFEKPADRISDEFLLPCDNWGQKPSLAEYKGLRGNPLGWLELTTLINFTGSPRVTELSKQKDGPCQNMMH